MKTIIQNTNPPSTQNIYEKIDKQLEGFYHWGKSSIKTFPCEKYLLSDCFWKLIWFAVQGINEKKFF